MKPSQFSSTSYHGTSVQTGAFQFIPLPFLDDWLIARWRRRLVRRVLDSRGITYDSKVARTITSWAKRGLFAHVRSTTTGLVMKPLKKVFRTVLIWLTARNAVRTTAETYFLARFMQHPDLMKGADNAHHLSNDYAQTLATALNQVIERIDQRVAGQAASKIWRNFRKRVKRADDHVIDSEEVGRVMEQEAPGILAEFDARVHELLA